MFMDAVIDLPFISDDFMTIRVCGRFMPQFPAWMPCGLILPEQSRDL